uniref:Uncharacterized protein n=2 Tax=Strongyloides stercoralis TaxID=6248 RepID=A0AAF5DHI6_STRER
MLEGNVRTDVNLVLINAVVRRPTVGVDGAPGAPAMVSLPDPDEEIIADEDTLRPEERARSIIPLNTDTTVNFRFIGIKLGVDDTRDGLSGFSPYKFTTSYGAFLLNDGIPQTEGAAKLFLMNIALTSLINKTVKDIYPAANYEFLRNTLRTSYNNAIRWVLDLVAVHQIKALKTENIKSYFLQYDTIKTDNSIVLRYLSFAAPALPKIYDTPRLRALLSKIRFMGMHSNVSSFPNLAKRAMACIGGYVDKFFSAETISLVTEISETPWDQNFYNKVTALMIIQVRCILLAFSCLPEGWIQGNKAEGKVDLSELRKRSAIATRFFELTSVDTAEIARMDLQALFSPVEPPYYK